MKKLIALLLLLSLLTCLLSSCSDQAAPLIGSWTGQIELADRLNAKLQAADAELYPYWKTESFPLELTMTFRSDGTYAITVNTQQLDGALSALKEHMAAGFREYLKDMIETAQKDMTVEELLQSLNISIEDQISNALGRDVADGIIRDFSCEGNFQVRDNKLFTSAGKEFKVNENIYEPFTLENDVLTLLTPVGTADTGIYPIVLRRTPQ